MPDVQFVRARPRGAAADRAAEYHGYRLRGTPPTVHRGLPSPFLTLILTVHDPLVIEQHVDPTRSPGHFDTLLGGLRTAPALIRHGGPQSGIQVQLDPLAARPLFGLPAGELAGQDDDAALIMGRTADVAQQRVAAAGAWGERFAVLDALLAETGTSETPPEVAHAWRLLLRTRGRLPVARLAREIGWSERNLTKRFRAEIGLTPKAAARVIRFDHARRALQSQAMCGGVSVASVAAQHGYYDQSHLVRDFTQFTGLAPSAWLAAEFGNFQATDVATASEWAS